MVQQQKRLTLCSCRCLVAGPWDGKRPDEPDGASRKEESSLSVDSDSEESSLSEDAELSPGHAKALPFVALGTFAGGCDPSSAAGKATSISKMHIDGVVLLGGRKSAFPAIPE